MAKPHKTGSPGCVGRADPVFFPTIFQQVNFYNYLVCNLSFVVLINCCVYLYASGCLVVVDIHSCVVLSWRLRSLIFLPQPPFGVSPSSFGINSFAL